MEPVWGFKTAWTHAQWRQKSRKKAQTPTWEHPKGSGIRIAEILNNTGGEVFGVSDQVRIPVERTGNRSRAIAVRQRHTTAGVVELSLKIVVFDLPPHPVNYGSSEPDRYLRQSAATHDPLAAFVLNRYHQQSASGYLRYRQRMRFLATTLSTT